MCFLIDDKPSPEAYFWNCVNVLATQEQIYLILEGKPVIIDQTKYQVRF